LAVVSDQTTHAVLGERVERALKGAYNVQSVVLPAAPHPDEEAVETVRRLTASADALIAVGSGSINDIAKYASAQDRKPYAVFATAPSMNGYTSLSAAITVHGHKLSLSAQAPTGAFFDLEVLAVPRSGSSVPGSATASAVLLLRPTGFWPINSLACPIANFLITF
jgi:glycerol-1-phosphate dehydrogenase [NAD(P)+]